MTDRSLTTLCLCVAGALLTFGIFAGEGLSIGVLVATPLLLGSLVLCRRLDPKREIGLVGIFALATGLRWLVATGVHLFIYSKRPGLFAPDEGDYEIYGRIVAALLSGQIPSLPPGIKTPGVVWVMGVLYWAFGPGPLMPKLVVGLSGAWSSVLVALIAARAFSTAVARRAGLIAAIVPSLVLWSSLELKDPWTLLGVELMLLCFLHLREKIRWHLALLFAGAFVVVWSNRSYEAVFGLVGCAISLIRLSRRRLLRGLLLIPALVAVIVVAVQASDALAVGEEGEPVDAVDVINNVRTGYATDAGSAVNLSLVDTSSALGMVLWIPIGLVYTYLAPFPFSGTSLISLATSPEMLVWYFLLPSLYRGARSLKRDQKVGALLPVIGYVLAASLGWSVMVGNVGSLYRYRAQMLFLPIILIAADQIRRREARRAFDLPLGLSVTRLHGES
jgi:hypothetical protein